MDHPPFMSESEETEVAIPGVDLNAPEANGALHMDRLPLDPEQAFLGALLLNPRAFLETERVMRTEYFHLRRHQVIFKAMRQLHERGLEVDPLSMATQLQRQGDLEQSGGVPYLDELSEKCPTSVNVLTYAQLVERKALLRKLVEAADGIRQLAVEGRADISEILEQAEERIFQIGQVRSGNDLTPIEEILSDVRQEMEELREDRKTTHGLPTGFEQLDKLLGGLNKSDLIVLAARPSMGKTGMALTMALSAALRLEAKVAVFSLEMGRGQVAQRLLAMESNMNLHDLRIGELSGRQWELVQATLDKVSDARLYLDDTPGASVADLRGKARRLHARVGLDLLVVDYLQLMSGGDGGSRGRLGENRQQEITYITGSLKNLARELNIPVIALSQLNRALESRSDKRPLLQDLRESGSIEQDADVVMFIYRDSFYDEGSLDQDIAEVRVAKHRNGALGMVKLKFKAETATFQELPRARDDYAARGGS